MYAHRFPKLIATMWQGFCANDVTILGVIMFIDAHFVHCVSVGGSTVVCVRYAAREK